MVDYPDHQRGIRLVGTDITLDIRIEASDVDLNIIFTDQSVAVWGIDAWVARQGDFKSFTLARSVDAGATVTNDLYTVDTDKVLYVSSFILSAEEDWNLTLYYTTPTVYLLGGYVLGRTPFRFPFSPPITVAAGKTLTVAQSNVSAASKASYVVVLGYELDA